MERETKRSVVRGWIAAPISGAKDAISGPLVKNAATLYGTTIITSFLGFFYWLVAARMVPARGVGIASAVQSTAQLLSIFCVLGLSTLLVSELSIDKSHARVLMLTASSLSGLVAIAISICVAIGLQSSSSVIREGVPGLVGISVFVALTALTTILLVLDDACVGLLRGDLQLRRNTVFAISKLALLPVFVLFWKSSSGVELVAAWMSGLALSLVTLGAALTKLTRNQPTSLEFNRLFEKKRLMAGHHWLNVSIQAPRLVLPIFVAVFVSARANASWTVAFLLIGIVNIIPSHFSTVLFALAPGDEQALHVEVKKTMKICLMLAMASAPFFFVFARPMLSLFGSSYDSAAEALAFLGLTTYPSAIKSHYIAISRVRGRMAQAGFSTLLGACLEVGVASLGGINFGLTGVAVGFLIGFTIEAAIFSPAVFSVLRNPSTHENHA